MAQLRGLVGVVLLGACFHDAGVVTGGPSTSAGETDTGTTTTTTSTTTTTTSTTTSTSTAATDPTIATTSGPASTSEASEASAASDASVGADQGAADLGPLPAACPDDPDLVACYLFDDGWDADLLIDAVGDHDGALLGATPTDGVRGLAALTLPTTAISVPAAIAPLGGAPWTVMAWVRVDIAPAPTRAGVVDRDFDYGIFIAKAGNVQCGNLMGTVLLPIGAWAHVACVWYPDHREIFVDGVLDASIADSSGRPPPGRPLVLANNSPPSADEALVGALDEVMLWRRSLGAAEICAAAGIACP